MLWQVRVICYQDIPLAHTFLHQLRRNRSRSASTLGGKKIGFALQKPSTVHVGFGSLVSTLGCRRHVRYQLIASDLTGARSYVPCPFIRSRIALGQPGAGSDVGATFSI
jgi:hypothetical protein